MTTGAGSRPSKVQIIYDSLRRLNEIAVTIKGKAHAVRYGLIGKSDEKPKAGEVDAPIPEDAFSRIEIGINEVAQILRDANVYLDEIDKEIE